MTPAKWLFIQDLPVFPSLDYIILTEHQLSAEFRPDEIIKSGWDFHAVSGGRFVLFFTQQKERKKKRPMGGVGGGWVSNRRRREFSSYKAGGF